MHENTPLGTEVDLAGSERIALTGAEGVTQAEARCINQSLFVLRKVRPPGGTVATRDRNMVPSLHDMVATASFLT